jgi:hypothetical protein
MLTLLVELPGIISLSEMTLQLSADRIHLSGGSYLLEIPLPARIRLPSASANFSAHDCTLKIEAAVHDRKKGREPFTRSRGV